MAIDSSTYNDRLEASRDSLAFRQLSDLMSLPNGGMADTLYVLHKACEASVGFNQPQQDMLNLFGGVFRELAYTLWEAGTPAVKPR